MWSGVVVRIRRGLRGGEGGREGRRADRGGGEGCGPPGEMVNEVKRGPTQSLWGSARPRAAEAKVKDLGGPGGRGGGGELGRGGKGKGGLI